MFDIIKGLWKWFVWIVAVLLLGAVILAFRIFVIDKDYDGTNSKNLSNKGKESSNENILVDENGNIIDVGKIENNIVNGVKDLKDSTVNGYKNDSEFEINPYEFDESFLLYRGENNEQLIKEMLDQLIINSDGNFFARTSVTSVGFGDNVTIEYQGNLTEYQVAIQKLKDDVSDGKYDVSYNYGALGATVNEIVITKK